jgi:hypothetical protein
MISAVIIETDEVFIRGVERSADEILRARRKIYRSRVKRNRESVCQTCGVLFQWRFDKGCKERKYCSKKCYGPVVSARRRRITANADELRRLYQSHGNLRLVAKSLGVKAASLQKRMAQLGVERNPTGQNHPAATRCIVPGCKSPLYFYRLPNGKMWGNRCLDHLREQNRLKQQRYAQRKRAA